MTITQKQNINNLRNRKSENSAVRCKKKRFRNLYPLLVKSLVVFIIVLGVAFVAGINDLSIKGFILAELKNELTLLEKDNEKLELRIMALESYENINARAEALRMVRVDKIEYITTIDDAVAKK